MDGAAACRLRLCVSGTSCRSGKKLSRRLSISRSPSGAHPVLGGAGYTSQIKVRGTCIRSSVLSAAEFSAAITPIFASAVGIVASNVFTAAFAMHDAPIIAYITAIAAAIAAGATAAGATSSAQFATISSALGFAALEIADAFVFKPSGYSCLCPPLAHANCAGLQ